jgi:hypothetical protein
LTIRGTKSGSTCAPLSHENPVNTGDGLIVPEPTSVTATSCDPQVNLLQQTSCSTSVEDSEDLFPVPDIIRAMRACKRGKTSTDLISSLLGSEKCSESDLFLLVRDTGKWLMNNNKSGKGSPPEYSEFEKMGKSINHHFPSTRNTKSTVPYVNIKFLLYECVIDNQVHCFLWSFQDTFCNRGTPGLLQNYVYGKRCRDGLSVPLPNHHLKRCVFISLFVVTRVLFNFYIYRRKVVDYENASDADVEAAESYMRNVLYEEKSKHTLLEKFAFTRKNRRNFILKNEQVCASVILKKYPLLEHLEAVSEKSLR